MKSSEIPDNPKIMISNYIYLLSDKIRVNLRNNIVSDYITRDTFDVISSKLGILKPTLKKYIRFKKYPIFFLRELDKTTNVDLFKLIERNKPIFTSKWKRVKLPRFITPKLAYFIGYLQGDGSIQSNKKRIDFTDEYIQQIENINQICFELFNIKGRIESRKSPLSKKFMYRLEIGSLVLNSYLHEVFQINRGEKINLRIPKIFLMNKEILKWYIIGLVDADGTLPKNPRKCKQFFIDVTFKDREFINQIKEALNLFEINTLKPYCRIAKSPSSEYISKTWELRIRKKEEIRKFLNRIGFFHSDKRVRVKRLLSIVGQ